MPLFQYVCKKCRVESEILVRGQEEPVCPKCGSHELEQQASMFNAVNGGGKRELAPCGLPGSSCCNGACGLN